MSASDAPIPEVGGPTSAAWQEEALARAEGLNFLKSWIRSQPNGSGVDECGASIDAHLAAAHDAATGSKSGEDAASGSQSGQDAAAGSKSGRKARTRALAGSPFERALANLDMAEVDLLRLADKSVLEGALPSIQAHVNRFLAKDDPRRVALDQLTKEKTSKPQSPLEDVPREQILNALRVALDKPTEEKTSKPQSPLEDVPREQVLNALYAANTQRRRNLTRLHSFRNMLWAGIGTGVVLAIALGVIGLIWPLAIPLCFTPEGDGSVTLACPQGTAFLGPAPLKPDFDVGSRVSATVKPGDILLVEFLGLIGAALSVTALFRGLRRGTSTPYNVAFLLAILKLPTGALTAVSGLILMRADFVPGLSALDSPAQILGWALVFGIAQQLVTQVADNRAHTLLEEVGGRGAAGDRPVTSRPRS
jgi:hypothetical protein